MCSLWKVYSRRRQPSSHPGNSGRPVLPQWIPMKGSSGSSRRKGSRPKSAGISVLFGTFLILLIFFVTAGSLPPSVGTCSRICSPHRHPAHSYGSLIVSITAPLFLCHITDALHSVCRILRFFRAHQKRAPPDFRKCPSLFLSIFRFSYDNNNFNRFFSAKCSDCAYQNLTTFLFPNPPMAGNIPECVVHNGMLPGLAWRKS